MNAFESAPGISGRAWIVTDASVSGGSSGGPAADTDGQLIGVTTTAGVLDCRPGDTNGDGDVNEADVGCIPVGSALAKLRPVNLAKPLLAGLPVTVPPTSESEPTGVNPEEKGLHTSPSYGWRLQWDDEVWALQSTDSSGDQELLTLELRGGVGTATFVTSPSAGRDAGDCVDESLMRMVQAPPGENLRSLEENGQYVALRASDRAYAALTIERFVGTPINAVVVSECRLFASEQALLGISFIYGGYGTPPDTSAWRTVLEDLLEGLELS